MIKVIRELISAIEINAQAVRELTKYLCKSNMTVSAFLLGEVNKCSTKITVDKPKNEPKPRYKYLATCVEDGVVTEADKKKDLADAIRIGSGGSLSKKINTGKIVKSRLTGYRYIIARRKIEKV